MQYMTRKEKTLNDVLPDLKPLVPLGFVLPEGDTLKKKNPAGITACVEYRSNGCTIISTISNIESSFPIYAS